MTNPKIVVVTGGTRGIGAAISLAFKYEGYKVISLYNGSRENAEQFSQQHNIAIFRWDVSDFEQCQTGIEQIYREFGTIDILINNAGITQDSMFHKMTPDQWDSVIRVNLTSCFNMSRCVVGGMREQNYGRIISISSVNAHKGQLGQANYAAAKAGIIGFTKSLAQELAGKGITVNAIAPGYIDTDMVRSVEENTLSKIIKQIGVGRLGSPEEVAHAAVFLADDRSSFITGATIHMNGGQYFV